MLALCAYSLLGCGAPDVEDLREAGNIKGLINVLGYENDILKYYYKPINRHIKLYKSNDNSSRYSHN